MLGGTNAEEQEGLSCCMEHDQEACGPNSLSGADAGTGNNTINDRLAKQRAQVVTKALVEKYGIAKERISTDSKGARVQPFAENNKNRVTIMIAK